MAYIIYIETLGGTMAPMGPKEDPPLCKCKNYVNAVEGFSV